MQADLAQGMSSDEVWLLQIDRLLVELAQQHLLHRLLLWCHELVGIFGWVVDQSLVVGAHSRQLVLQERLLAFEFA